MEATSTQTTYIYRVSEYVRNVSCPGGCHGFCKVETDMNYDAGNIVQDTQGSAQEMTGSSFINGLNTQEFGVLGEINLLEAHSGRVDGFVEAQHFILSGESGDRNVSVKTVHTDCTPVRTSNFCTGAVDMGGRGDACKCGGA